MRFQRVRVGGMMMPFIEEIAEKEDPGLAKGDPERIVSQNRMLLAGRKEDLYSRIQVGRSGRKSWTGRGR